MPLSAYAQKACLDWLLGGANPTRPTAWAIGLSLGTPSSTSASEASVSGYARKTVGFSAAASPAGSAVNSVAVTMTVSSACTLKAVQIWDTILASGSGNMLWYGLMSASSVMVAADTLSFAVGSINISLS